MENEMKITTIGKGNNGGGLADLWEKAGHEVNRIGHEGGDASDADVVLVAVPGGAIEEALAGVSGLDGKTVLDSTNFQGDDRPPAGAGSNAEYVKSVTGGPTAKAFNGNFAALLGQIADASTKPGSLWCGDEDAREATERLIEDAGYQPINCGGLDSAPIQENFVALAFAVAKAGGMGPFFYKFAPPAEF
jgi:8-hydroxy-5-deazaflavin:NADPH oxidoreductase